MVRELSLSTGGGVGKGEGVKLECKQFEGGVAKFQCTASEGSDSTRHFVSLMKI